MVLPLRQIDQGQTYYPIQSEELRPFKYDVDIIDPMDIRGSHLHLCSERGANRHCKILDTVLPFIT
ncbi:MAG: hypothetical protein P4L49_07030 [Desulfosporosinus sp.]|nr:hypothetical protein [Desulfosporosinus sp.]